MKVGDIVKVNKDYPSVNGFLQIYSISDTGESYCSTFTKDARYRVEKMEESSSETYIYLNCKSGRFDADHFDLIHTKEDTWLDRSEREGREEWSRRMLNLGPDVSKPIRLQIDHPRTHYHHIGITDLRSPGYGQASSFHVHDSRVETLMTFEDLEGNSNVEWKDDQSDILVIKQLVKLNL